MRRLLRNRFLLPSALVLAVGVGGVLTLGTGAGAAPAGLPTSPGATTNGQGAAGIKGDNFNAGVSLPPGVRSPKNLKGPRNSGFPNSTITQYANGGPGKGRQLVRYGNSAITYTVPPASYIQTGKALFAQNCSSCHGDRAQGSAIAPNLQGVGPATVDFWVSTGRMPATHTNEVQAERKPPRLSSKQAKQIAAWVNSLDPAIPYIPHPNLKNANLADGLDLFALNCAACHAINGVGDALAYGTNAPSLWAATPQQVVEAIRTGPSNMPRFTGNLTDAQVRDVAAYVTEHIAHPTSPGGAGLGFAGPVTEGFVALLIGVGALVLIGFWIGERS